MVGYIRNRQHRRVVASRGSEGLHGTLPVTQRADVGGRSSNNTATASPGRRSSTLSRAIKEIAAVCVPGGCAAIHEDFFLSSTLLWLTLLTIAPATMGPPRTAWHDPFEPLACIIKLVVRLSKIPFSLTPYLHVTLDVLGEWERDQLLSSLGRYLLSGLCHVTQIDSGKPLLISSLLPNLPLPIPLHQTPVKHLELHLVQILCQIKPHCCHIIAARSSSACTVVIRIPVGNTVNQKPSDGFSTFIQEPAASPPVIGDRPFPSPGVDQRQCQASGPATMQQAL